MVLELILQQGAHSVPTRAQSRAWHLMELLVVGCDWPRQHKEQAAGSLPSNARAVTHVDEKLDIGLAASGFKKKHQRALEEAFLLKKEGGEEGGSGSGSGSGSEEEGRSDSGDEGAEGEGAGEGGRHGGRAGELRGSLRLALGPLPAQNALGGACRPGRVAVYCLSALCSGS